MGVGYMGLGTTGVAKACLFRQYVYLPMTSVICSAHLKTAENRNNECIAVRLNR